eukprot:1639742-Prorocentrum_lima.AAC.1
MLGLAGVRFVVVELLHWMHVDQDLAFRLGSILLVDTGYELYVATRFASLDLVTTIVVAPVMDLLMNVK